MDVSVSKNFNHDRYVYFTFTETGAAGSYGQPATLGTSVARARLSEDNAHVTDWTVLLRQAPRPDPALHFGARLAWDPSGYLYVTTGDLGLGNVDGDVQSANTLLGKVLRIHSDGSAPISNPFASGDSRAEIWSYGHRNVQGAAVDPYTGALWTTEHGPSGGDELNKPQAGLNYGWPLIGYGTGYPGNADYFGLTSLQGIEQPIYYWDPSVAPSGMAFYHGTMFPEWNGLVLIASLRGGLIRLMLLDDKVVGEQIHFETELGRTRDVEVGPDGAIYLLRETDGGSLVRLRRD